MTRSERLRGTVLWVGAVLGSACLLWAVAVAAFGLTPLVFTSGSMSPAIGAGDLSFARTVPAGELSEGDVVSVENSRGVRVTHRVVDVDPTDEGAVLSLKGDANSTPDAEAYNVTSVERVVVTVPKLGHLIVAASSRFGIFLGGLIVGGALLAAFRRPVDRDGTPRPGARRRARPGDKARTGAAVALVLVTLSALSAGQGVRTTTAAFSDTGTALSGTLRSLAVVSQAQPLCTNVNGFLGLGDLARLTWTQVDPRFEYRWELRGNSTGSLVNSGVAGTGTAAGDTVTLDLHTGLLGIDGNYNVFIRARLVGTPTWVAATTTTTPVRRVSFLGLGAQFRCGHY